MYVAGFAGTLDEHLGQSVESIDRKGAGSRILRPLTAPEGGIAVTGAEDPGRTF